MSTTAVPAVEGWFTTDAEPHLLGTRCTSCGTVFFPRAAGFCRNPECRGREFEEVALSRTGTVWSYTDAQYQPPPPYIPAADPYEPFALAAVELADEQVVVLGQVAKGFGVDDLRVGATVELVVEPLYELDGVEHLIYRWKPVAGSDS
ncbi:MAG: OB-fold domain-containing protein [Actinomycetota bacterium]|nr:OB-fold domain-containing protein [Actinomycetota bacterium]